jgi:hypothetical protein
MLGAIIWRRAGQPGPLPQQPNPPKRGPQPGAAGEVDVLMGFWRHTLAIE